MHVISYLDAYALLTARASCYIWYRHGSLGFVLQCLVLLHVNYVQIWYLFLRILRNILTTVKWQEKVTCFVLEKSPGFKPIGAK